jgi:hypothetical protein
MIMIVLILTGKMIMTWNYRIIKFGDEHYSLHEVYYNEAGEPTMYTTDAIDFVGESRHEVVMSLFHAFRDATKHPVLTPEDFVPYDYERED